MNKSTKNTVCVSTIALCYGVLCLTQSTSFNLPLTGSAVRCLTPQTTLLSTTSASACTPLAILEALAAAAEGAGAVEVAGVVADAAAFAAEEAVAVENAAVLAEAAAEKAAQEATVFAGEVGQGAVNAAKELLLAAQAAEEAGVNAVVTDAQAVLANEQIVAAEQALAAAQAQVVNAANEAAAQVVHVTAVVFTVTTGGSE